MLNIFFCDMLIYNARFCVIVLLNSRKRGMARKEILNRNYLITIAIGVHMYLHKITRAFLL